MLNAFRVGHVQQLKAQRKFNRGDALCECCEGRYLDTIYHLVFFCVTFAAARTEMIDDLIAAMSVNRRHWDRMAPDKRLYEMLFPCRDAWAAGNLKDKDKERPEGNHIRFPLVQGST